MREWSMSTIAENIARVKERIAERALRVGRSPEEITLIAVSKRVDISRIEAAISAGITSFGENYVQEAKEKITRIDQGVAWHMIGHLQTNKVKYVVPLFSMIHSVDSVHLAKSGIASDELVRLLEAVAPLGGVSVKGLMTMPPYFPDQERARPFYRELRELRDRLLPVLPDSISLAHLSMGMSGDFEVAIEEGATMVRVGTAVFGERT
jgi:uncharacterized pyridoxal phosphate-containing UPF0001 family protein